MVDVVVNTLVVAQIIPVVDIMVYNMIKTVVDTFGCCYDRHG